jgi:glycosyltransferase involved in cell wall biosynthesis
MTTVNLGFKVDGNLNLLVLIPIYNDWEAVWLLLRKIDEVLAGNNLRFEVLIVDDGSTVRYRRENLGFGWEALDRVRILHLVRNLGHQRAIAIGLMYVRETGRYTSIVIMDGDGRTIRRYTQSIEGI